MNDIVDLHCHILPGLDDGSQSLEDSIEMGKKAVSQGISDILCTPHSNDGKYNNQKDSILEKTKALQNELNIRHIPLILHPGQEVHISGELLQLMDDNRILYADINNKYIMLEFPHYEVPQYANELFFELSTAGKIPVIVHPERNAAFIKDPNLLIKFLDAGALAQLTAPSYLGWFGKSIQKVSKKMMEHNMVQLIASDAHGNKRRDFYMDEAFKAIALDFGSDYANKLNNVAKDILNGKIISDCSYTSIKKRSITQLFRRK